MAVVVKVTNQRYINAHAVKLLPHIGHSLGRFGGVHRDTDHLRASQCQLFDLNGRGNRINRIGIGHGLDAHRRIAANGHDAGIPDHARLT